MTRRMLAMVGFASLLAGFVATPVYAMDLTYTGGTGDFLDPSKWMPTGPPGTDDVAIINSGAVTLNSDATVAGLQLNGGMLEGSGVLTVTGSVLWTGGFMGGTGTTNANGGLSVASASTIGLVGTRTLNNAAAGTFTGSISFNNQPSGILNNLPTGTFAITTSADFLGGNFVNQGALTKTAGTGDGVTRFSGAFNNSGSVAVMSGELDLDAGGTHTGAFSVDAGAVLSFSGGTHTVSGGAAGVGGGGTVEFGGGTANLNGGTYNVSGTTRVSGGSNHTIAGGVNVTGVGALVISAGSFALSGGEMVTVPSYMQTGGTFGGSDTVTVSGPLGHGGTMAGSGTTNANGGLTISSDTPISLSETRTLNNAAAGSGRARSASTTGPRPRCGPCRRERLPSRPRRTSSTGTSPTRAH